MMNHKEFRTNYPREKQIDREDIVKAMADQIRDQESGVYTRRYLEGDGILEMEAKEQCLEQWWIGRLDSHCREERRRGAPVRDLVVDAKKRIAAHEKRASRREPATTMFQHTSW